MRGSKKNILAGNVRKIMKHGISERRMKKTQIKKHDFALFILIIGLF